MKYYTYFCEKLLLNTNGASKNSGAKVLKFFKMNKDKKETTSIAPELVTKIEELMGKIDTIISLQKEMVPEKKPFLTQRETAKMLGLSDATISYMVKKKKITPVVGMGKTLKFSRKEVERLLNK